MNSQNFIMIYVAAFLAVFCQASLPGLHQWLGTQVDLLPALMIYAALYTNLFNVTLLSILSGLWVDSLSENPLGISILPLFITGLVIFIQRELILRESTFAQMVLGAVAGAVVPLMKVLLLLSGGKALLLGWGSLWQWLVMTAACAAATPLMFAVFGWFQHMFGYKLRTESSFRPDREIRRSRL